jgi:putative transposase
VHGFVSDSIVIGRRFRTLSIVDNYSQECPAVEVYASMGGPKVVSVLDRLTVRATRGDYCE